MKRRLIIALLSTALYLIIANLGNIFFGISKDFNWTTTLWESLFFFIFIFLLLGYRNKHK